MLGFGLVITAAAGLVVLAAVPLLRRVTAQPVLHAASTLGVFLIAGLVRGWLFFNLADFFNFHSNTSLELRLANSSTTTVFWLTICSIGFHSQNVYRQRLETLLGQALLARYSRITRSELAAELAGLEADFKSLGGGELNEQHAAALQRAAEEVRRLIAQRLRPLSHRLWLQGRSAYPRVRYSALMKDGLRNLDYSTTRVALFFGVTTFTNLVSATGLPTAVLRTSVGVVFIVAAHRLRTRFVNGTAESAAVYLGAFTTAASATSELLAALLGLPNLLPYTIFFMPYAPAIMLLDSMAALAMADRERLLEELQRALDESPEEEVESAQLAAFLHNSLQNELLAMAANLESAATADPAQQRRTLEQLHSLLNRSISEQFEDFADSPGARLERVVRGWRDILDIDFALAPDSLDEDSRSRLLVQLIEESASNAVRHGGATWLRATQSVEADGSWRVTVTNNGQRADSGSGIGGEWLRRHALRHEVTERVGECEFTYWL